MDTTGIYMTMAWHETAILSTSFIHIDLKSEMLQTMVKTAYEKNTHLFKTHETLLKPNNKSSKSHSNKKLSSKM